MICEQAVSKMSERIQKFVLLMDRARTHISDERNFAVGDAEAPPRALQTSECSELLNPTRTSYLILVQRQPGKLAELAWITKYITTESLVRLCLKTFP
jgi:hypothetical protein